MIISPIFTEYFVLFKSKLIFSIEVLYVIVPTSDKLRIFIKSIDSKPYIKANFAKLLLKNGDANLVNPLKFMQNSALFLIRGSIMFNNFLPDDWLAASFVISLIIIVYILVLLNSY